MASLNDKFARAKGIVLTDYKGMSVGEITELRDALRGSGIEYKVVKNTLARIAASETPVAALKESFRGPVGVAMGYDDAAVVTKSVLEFAKKNEKIKVTCGVVDGAYCDVEQLNRIASLPTREVLLSMLAGTFQAPQAKLARLLSASVTRFAYAISALREQRAAG